MALLATGPNAHGHGHLPDGREFAFRVRNRKAWLEVYRADAEQAAPAPGDIELVAEHRVGDLDLDDSGNITDLLDDMVRTAGPTRVEPERTVRSYLTTLHSLFGDDATGTGSAA